MQQAGLVTKSLSIALSLTLALSACAESPYAEMSEDEIHARARTLPLPERYAFYLEVNDSTIPGNPIVAEDLVLLGAPARQYVVRQALVGKRHDLTRAMSALSAFSGPCSPQELKQLREKADRVAYGDKDRRAIEERILVACEIAVPSGVRNSWKPQTDVAEQNTLSSRRAIQR